MTHTHTPRPSHETSAHRTTSTPSTIAQHISLRQINRFVAGLWAVLVAVLLVIAASSASYGQASEPSAQRARLTTPAPKNLDQVSRQISYPRSAQIEKHSGTVIAELLVDRDGRPIQYAVEGEAAPELKQAVAEHLFDLRFEPAQRDGEPVRMYVRIPFAFVLR